MNRLRALPGLALALILAACATPQKRIEARPELFASFPAEARERIQQGRIDLGFTPEMVRMAKGDPNLVSTRHTRDTTRTIWTYTRLERRTYTQPVNVTGRGRGAYAAWVDTEDTREVETLRVEFQDNEVVAYEQPEQP